MLKGFYNTHAIYNESHKWMQIRRTKTSFSCDLEKLLNLTRFYGTLATEAWNYHVKRNFAKAHLFTRSTIKLFQRCDETKKKKKGGEKNVSWKSCDDYS